MTDRLGEECGVFGIWGCEEAAAHTVLGLHAMQHRGQEAAGIVSLQKDIFHCQKHAGLVGDAFSSEDVMGHLPGMSAIGHVRYSTTGDSSTQNIQPFYAELFNGPVALAHNGNLTNALTLRRDLVQKGHIFHSSSDTEVLLHLMARPQESSACWKEILKQALLQIEGAYSLVMLTRGALYGIRDPWGLRPLVLGQRNGTFVLASESCALDIMGATLIRDVAPGELITIDASGMKSEILLPKAPSKFCIFEYIYFSRPDSVLEGNSVYEVRKNIGRYLAGENPVAADVVVPVPDSGVPAALGYAEHSGIPFDLGIIRNHYVGRTFIEPTQSIRLLGVKLKHNPNKMFLQGKRVILVDDSIVRGTTSMKIVSMVRSAGATEVHMRIASPPTTHSCFYGVDTPSRDHLMAAHLSTQAMAEKIGVDSLAFISLDGLYRAVGQSRRDPAAPQYCDACFTGDYPIALTDVAKHLV
jgi:amidophosphoribosyltransferase